MALRVGIPRGLLFYYYYPLWENFFGALGVEIVLSSATSRTIFNRGIALANDETCLPVKIFYGHVESLREQRVDYIFLPRMVSMEKGTYLCPKLLGFPEVISSMLDNLPPILSVNFNMRKNNQDLNEALSYLGRKLGFAYAQVKKAARIAREAQDTYEKLLECGVVFERAIELASTRARLLVKGCENEELFNGFEQEHNLNSATLLDEDHSQHELTLGVLGHAYLLYDAFTSIDIIEKLNKMGVIVITPENMAPELIESQMNGLAKKMFWSHSKRILGAGFGMVEDMEIDGVIHLTCFGCGPDSMVGDMVERSCRRANKPFMTISLDEHTGEAGVITRLEAYIDMLRRGKKRESNLSTHG